MCLEVVYADINPFDHVQKVRLQDKRLSRMIEHSSCVFQFLKIFQTRVYVDSQLQQFVLLQSIERNIENEEDEPALQATSHKHVADFSRLLRRLSNLLAWTPPPLSPHRFSPRAYRKFRDDLTRCRDEPGNAIPGYARRTGRSTRTNRRIVEEFAQVALDAEHEKRVDGPRLEGLQGVSSGWGRVCVVIQDSMDGENLRHLF